jgi:hypothetical protein
MLALIRATAKRRLTDMASFDTVTLKQQSRGTVAGLQFDAVISELHTQRLQVTENPIETGVNIADHCFVEASELQLVASVADIKMQNAAGGYDSSIGRSNYAYQKLADLERQLAQNELQPFEIVTSVKVYRRMVMTEIQMSRDKTTPLLGRFQMSFKQIITVDTQNVSYTPLAGSTARSASPRKDSGNLQPKPATDQQTNAVNRDSKLLKALQWGGAIQ